MRTAKIVAIVRNRRITHERSSIQSGGKEVRDLSVVAGGAGCGVARLSAVLREGRGKVGSVHGVERPGTHARDHLPEVV